jgi:hypothetical protein
VGHRSAPRKSAARHFGGYIWLVVLVIFWAQAEQAGITFWGPLRAEMGDDGDDFFNCLWPAAA